MRTTITLAFFPVALCTSAQGYIPFPEGDATWMENHGWLNSGGGMNDSYVTCAREVSFGTDTTIGAVSYHRLYVTGFCADQLIFPPLSTTYYWEPTTLFLTFRQDIPAKQVILYDPNDGLEHVLYDFNMGLGTYPQTWNNVSYPIMQVIRVDSVQLADGWHEVYNTDMPDLGPDSVRVIEGIGSTFGLTAWMMTPFENHERLTCFTHHDSIVWTNPAVPGDPVCSLEMAVTAQREQRSGAVVSPMPFIDGFTVRLPAGVASANYRLFSATGHLVQEGRLDGVTEITVEAPGGCYVLDIADAVGGPLARQRLIKL